MYKSSFFILKKQNREQEKEDDTMSKKEYYLYVRGKAVPVSEEVYKVYWKITEHEKYLQRKDCNGLQIMTHTLLFVFIVPEPSV